jgi:hypothetical protein
VIKIVVEGDTEELFVKRWLLPHLRDRGLSTRVDVVNSNAKLIGDIADFADSALSAKSVDFVFFLLDLYPERGEYGFKSSDDLDTKVKKARECLLGRIDKSQRGRARIHFSVHEVEAWVLCNGEGIQRRAGLDHTPSFRSPESVDFENPPKKQLRELWRRGRLKRSYIEKIDGPELIKELDLETVKAACPYFARLVADLMSPSA